MIVMKLRCRCLELETQYPAAITMYELNVNVFPKAQIRDGTEMIQ
jgi:hypothetical protein